MGDGDLTSSRSSKAWRPRAPAPRAVLGNRWPTEVAAEALESLAVVRRELRGQPGFARPSAKRDLGMELEAPGASHAKRPVRSRSALVALVVAEEPHELGRWNLGARRQDVVVVRVQADARAPAAKETRDRLLDSADDVCHVLIARRVLPDETHALFIEARDEDAVGDQRVRVGVETCAVREAL